MPDRWPRAMRAPVAAEYVGLSLSAFHRYVHNRIIPAPHPYPDHPRQEARAVAWMREDLDAWLDRMAGRQPVSAEDTPWPVENGSNHAPVPANLHRQR